MIPAGVEANVVGPGSAFPPRGWIMRPSVRGFCVAVVAVLLAGCAAKRLPPPHSREDAVGVEEAERPGRADRAEERSRDRREERRRGDSEEGTASWYGKKYHGRRTSSGERYDMHAMTAAHRDLPFGTVVRVTNLRNGKNVRVTINDRGPFVEGRIIDLSYAAAKKLDMVRDGVVPVRVEILRR